MSLPVSDYWFMSPPTTAADAIKEGCEDNGNKLLKAMADKRAANGLTVDSAIEVYYKAVDAAGIADLSVASVNEYINRNQKAILKLRSQRPFSKYEKQSRVNPLIYFNVQRSSIDGCCLKHS